MAITAYEAKRILRDAAMRRALLSWLQEQTKENHNQPWPDIEPMLDDGQVAEELRRILGIRRLF